LSHLPTPAELGAPAKYSLWRQGQESAVSHFLNSSKRAIAGAEPTGFGKTVKNIACALLTGQRFVYLTSTKGLQDQVIRDFAEAGITDIRGMGNYECHGMDATELRLWGMGNRSQRPWPGVDEGPCHDGKKCDLKETTCGYYAQWRKAKLAQGIVTNYSYWMSINRYGEGLGDFHLMILDEAHEVPDELSAFMRIEIGDHEVSQTLGFRWPKRQHIHDWRIWAQDARAKVDSIIERSPEMRGSEKKKLKSLDNRLKELVSIEEAWIPERHERSWSWEPVWPAPYAESNLFLETPKLIFSSATMRPKTLELMGLKPEQYDFREYPSSFAVASRPVFLSTTYPPVRVDRRMTPTQWQMVKAKADQIIRGRQDRKGLIHTVSYDRARDIIASSQYRHLMMSHSNAWEAQKAIAAFKAKPQDSGAILVSPSIDTGHDFPGEEARYQIIIKVGFPDTRSPVMAERQKLDKAYGIYLALIKLVQSAGRIVRGPEDWGETFIIDAHAGWVVWKYQEFVPKYFLDAWRGIQQIPEAPPLRRMK
jgi:Rad3-related DNA helicase